jgi:hypothetical protein
MRPTRRMTLPLAAAVAGGLIAGPALAAAATTVPAAKPAQARSTTVLLKASKSTVAPKHKDTLTATLKSARRAVTGETLYLEKREAGSRKFSNPIAVGATDANGHVVISVVPGNKKGVKEQGRVVFQGDTGYKSSHSRVITVTVSSASQS